MCRLRIEALAKASRKMRDEFVMEDCELTSAMGIMLLLEGACGFKQGQVAGRLFQLIRKETGQVQYL